MNDLSVTVKQVAEPCEVCGIPTRVRIEGRPGTYKCLAPKIEIERQLADVEVGELRMLAPITDPKVGPYRWGKAPYWRPQQPDPIDLVRVAASMSWQRPYTGEVVVLDRSGAWISAAASVDVAHGALEHTGTDYTAGHPGIVKTEVYPWLEAGVPHPIGPGAETMIGAQVWITTDRHKLLADLARHDRYPEPVVLDSYSSEHKARLDKWAAYVQSVRVPAIRVHGRDSEQYAAVKIAFSQAIALMLGNRAPGQPRTWKCDVHRPDWAMAVQDLAACNLWRVADRCRAAGVAPVALRNTDELVLPADKGGLLDSLSEGDKPIIRLDPSGVTLGTFKIKSWENWSD